MTDRNLASVSWIRTAVLLLVWFGGGLWGLDLLSARREVACDPPNPGARCTVSEKRLSATRVLNGYAVSDILFAEETSAGSSFMSPSTTTLEIHTKSGLVWLSNDDFEGGISKWSAEIAINAYLKATGGSALVLRGSLPSAFLVTAAVFCSISIFLVGGVVVAARLGTRTTEQST